MRICQSFGLFLLLFSGAFSFAACPIGDIDGDCSVGLGDLSAIAEFWLDGSGTAANLDGFGKVDLADFAILAGHWGQGQYQLLINEFMADNKGTIEDPDQAGRYPDWIEIYNPGATPVDIGGMYLTDTLSLPKMWQIPTDAPSQTTIPAGGYRILWADGETAQGPLHVGFSLKAGGEEIGLFDSAGNQLDAVAFGSQNADQSYGRYPNGGAGWQTFAAGTVTPGWSNDGKSADAGILINEIMYHPGHDETAFVPEPVNLEYIELYNTGTDSVDLGGWRLVDGVQFRIPADTVITAGGYLVIAADEAAFAVAYPAVTHVVGGWTGKLTNKDEKITLVNAIGTEIDTVHYHDDGEWNQRILGPVDHYHRGWQWSSAADGGGYSLELLCAAVSNEYGRNWQAGKIPGGTPGAVNSNSVSNLAPIIRNVGQTPIIPTASQKVTVTAEVIDENPAGVSVVLHWRLDTSTYSNESVYPTYDPASYTTATMYDDGAHGDGQPGDGVFGGTIPAQTDDAIIEFFVEATDTGANRRTWPAACDVDGMMQQVANCLYQVDDTFDAAAARTPGAVPRYFIVMTECERARLYDIGNDTQPTGNEHTAECNSNAYMNATFISIDGVDTKIRYGVGVRNRGNSSRHTPPMNYHVGFRQDDKWKNVTALNINAEYPYIQVIGSAIWKMAGIPAPTSTLIELKVNGQNLANEGPDPDTTMHGHYAALESYNSDWTANNFPLDPDGNLYRCTYWTVTSDADRTYADLEHHGTAPYRDPADYWVNYMKETNGSEQNWNDVFDLIDTLMSSGGTEEEYLAQAEQSVDVGQWLRYLATDYLCGNAEAGFSYGMGDDYAMYRATFDTRFRLLPHDLGSMLGDGGGSVNNTSIFSVDRDRLQGIHRLINNKDVLKRYYNTFFELIDSAYSPEKFDPLADTVLGGKVPSSIISTMKQFVANRQNGTGQILSQIPQQFTIVGPISQNGYSHTTGGMVSLSGSFNATLARSMRVGGQLVPDANWNQKSGTWSISGIALNPGINNIAVEAFSRANGNGDSVYRGSIDVWYDDGSVASVTTLAGNVVLDAASGPWYIPSSMTVPVGSTLTIEPGTTVYFGSGARLTVNGRMVAEGTEFNRISLAGGNPPSTSTNWGGILFSNSNQDNRLVCVDMRNSGSASESIRLNSSKALVDGLTWSQTNKVIMQIEGSSAIVRNCVFPDNTGDQSVSGHLLLSADPYLIFDNNVFGVHTGTKKDVLDCTVSGPTPVPQFTNNVFMGGGDDALDLDGTHAFVAGNTFMNFHRNFSASDGESYGVTSGYDGSNTSSHMIVRNLFINCDNAALVKDHSWINFQNNTLVNCTVGVNFREPLETTVDPGDGAYMAGNIFYKTPNPIGVHYLDDPSYGTTDLTVEYSLITDTIPARFLGSGNIVGEDAVFVNTESDFHLKGDSAAIGSGVNGLDMGRYVSAGASISGQQDMTIPRAHAAFTVAGPGITHYKWRLDGGAWSAEQTVDTPLAFSGLTQGGHTLEVVGGNYADVWQETAEATVRRWTVDTSRHVLQLNEVRAADADSIELYYDGANAIDLGGYRLTDNRELPDKFVFAAGTTVNPGDYLVVYADANSLADGIHTGFGIDADGDDLYLLNATSDVVDSVSFGRQLQGLSVGRLSDGRWHLTVPTPGSANIRQSLGDPAALKINEWLADAKILFTHDFIELYNPGSSPVNLGELYLTDNDITWPLKSALGTLSFIGPNGYAVFVADGSNTKGHLSFNLSSDHEVIALFDADRNEIDKVWYGPQTTDVSQGRVPNSDSLAFFTLPTPGMMNLDPGSQALTLELVDDKTPVLYHVPTDDTDQGAWMQLGYGNSGGWQSDSGALGFGDVFAGIGSSAEWRAFNDCHTSPLGGTQANATRYTLYSGSSNPTSGPLKDFATGSSSGMPTVTVSSVGTLGTSTSGSSAGTPLPGTDAYAYFYDLAGNPIVDFGGNLIEISSGQSQVITFTDLNPAATYQFIGTMIRSSSYPTRKTQVTISGHDSASAVSSSGISTPTPDTAVIFPADNSGTGYVVGWTDIACGADRSFTITSQIAPGGYSKSYPIGGFLLEQFNSGPGPLEQAMLNHNASVYERIEFDLDEDPARLASLLLSVRYEDGFVAYLNGVRVVSANVSQTPAWNSHADSDRDNPLATTYVNFDISQFINILSPGTNVLAIHALNDSASDSDFLIQAHLEAGLRDNSGVSFANAAGILDGLRITEIMYNPAADPNAEFIELKNIGNTAINLEGVRFTDGVDFVFPPMTLSPAHYTVVVADQAVFEARYGTLINVAGQYAGKLDNGGDKITLKLPAPFDAAVMRFDYRDGWYPATDGGGHSLVITDPAGPLIDWQDEDNWRPSYAAGGTPGADDIAGVVINEVLAHSHDTAPDWIELYNPTGGSVNVGGWFLSDSAEDLRKYQIAADTVIPSNGYLVLYEDTHFGEPGDAGKLEPFALSENGDNVYLSSGENGKLTGYTVEVSFGASETGVSFGRYVRSDGTAVFVSMAEAAPNDDNSGPKVGPVVISEMMYNPPAGGSYAAQEYEYIELHNISDLPVTLQEYDAELGVTPGWRFTAGVDFTFPPGTIIPADGYLIIAKNPAAFAARYGTVGAAVLGPFENATSLSNGGELLALSKPGDTDLSGVRYYIQVDAVLYDDEDLWPATPDGGGQALDRVDDRLYGDDVVNWQARPASPGEG